MRRGAGEARVADDEGRVVLLLRLEDVQQRNRVGLRRIATDQEDRPRQRQPDTDTSRDYVYTDWDSVKRFAEEFLATLVVEAAPGARA